MNDPDLHLLVDDHEIQEYINLKRIINKPRKLPEPLIVSDRPWEGYRTQAWGSVIQEPDGLIRCWYFSTPARKPGEDDVGGYCYAESRDGIHFEKPNLGVAEFRGSKDNNIWYPMSPDGKNVIEQALARARKGLTALDEQGEPIGVVNNMDGLTVVRDDDDPDPQRRYKLIANMQDHCMWAYADPKAYPDITKEQEAHARDVVFGQYLDTSPDGIHWTRKPRRMVSARYGDYMMVTRDERNRRWWLNERARSLVGRTAAIRTSSDFVNWSPPESIFVNTPEMGFGLQYQWHGGITPFNYGNQNLGMLEKWSYAGFGDNCELVSQREGQRWERVAPGEPFLDIGDEGAFDRFIIFPTHNAPIRIGDELFIYYSGAGAMTAGSSPDSPGEPMAIGVACIGLDRFAGLAHSRYTPGELLTRQMVIEKPNLSLNVEALKKGEVRLAVLNLDGSFVPGYEFDDSEIDIHRDPYRSAAKWKTKPDLSELIGREVWLHFQIVGSVLYSYRFT